VVTNLYSLSECDVRPVGGEVRAGRYYVDSHTLCLKLALSDACHCSEMIPLPIWLVFSLPCTVDKRMHVHPGIESGPYALSFLMMFLSKLLALGAAITLRLVGSRNAGSGKAASGWSFVSAVEWT